MCKTYPKTEIWRVIYVFLELLKNVRKRYFELFW